MRILLIEDDPAIGTFAKIQLVNGGHTVLGPAATARAAFRLAARRHPQIALVDIDLSEHDDGVYVAEQLKLRWAIPSLFVTGSVEAARRRPTVALGLLTKPYSGHVLLRCVDAVAAKLDGRSVESVPEEVEWFGQDPVSTE